MIKHPKLQRISLLGRQIKHIDDDYLAEICWCLGANLARDFDQYHRFNNAAQAKFYRNQNILFTMLTDLSSRGQSGRVSGLRPWFFDSQTTN